MKPLIYFDFETAGSDKNCLIIKKDRLTEILEEVYQAGYNDGLKVNNAIVSYTDTNKIWNQTGKIITTTTVN